MSFKSVHLLKLLKHSQYISNKIRLVSTTTNYGKIAAKKEYKNENSLIYYEDPDNFGTLSRQVNNLTDLQEDEDDLKEEKYLENKPLLSQKLTTKQYADLIKQYLKHKRLKQAIEVLEVRMLVNDRVKPENYIYNILIGACAEFGYTMKAFKLYNDMKRRALKVTGDTYTCLFNACANSPWSSDGLDKARHLRTLMLEKGVEPNLTNYNSMVKAFGRCGDLSTAFQIVDEMKNKGIKVRVHTLNFLLQACITDKNTGLRHALVVWRKMLKLREKPNIYSFNLMLKCVKECNLGSTRDIEELMQIVSMENLVLDSKTDVKLLKQKTTQVALEATDMNVLKNDKAVALVKNTQVLEVVNNFNRVKSSTEAIPNLLSKNPQLQHVLSMQEVSSLQDKFAIIGGEVGFLREMQVYDVKPDIKTFTQMLMLLKDTTEAEDKLIVQMKEHNVKTDIDFYNMLIKKRCLRGDYDSANAVKDMINKENEFRKKKSPAKKKLKLKFNIMTYGVLAMACRTKESAENLLQEMKDKGLKLNAEILGTLLRQGTVNSNFGYVLYIMNTVKNENLEINKCFLKHLEDFDYKCKCLAKVEENGKAKSSKTFLDTYRVFRMAYKKWLQEINVEESLKDEHPWRQFQEDIPEPVQRQQLVEEPKRFYKNYRKFVPPYAVRFQK